MKFPFGSRPPAPGLELPDLDAVKWDNLEHAYGSATDVPGLLRDLASRDKERGEKALHEFYGNIWHQGTTYQATSYAVPFLRQILADSLNPFRAEIAELLADLAFGHSYHDVHQHMIFHEGERDKPAFQEKVQRELNDVERAHRAVEAGVAQYLELANDKDADAALRARAVHLAALFGRANAAVAPALWARLASETDERVRASLWLGLLFCDPAQLDIAAIERAFAKPPSALEEWALAALILRLGADKSRAASVMLNALDDNANDSLAESYQELPFCNEGLAADSLAQLLALGLEARQFAPQLCAKLRAVAKQWPALALLESLCPLFFGDFSQENPVSWQALDGSQREVLRALAQTPNAWGDENVILVNFTDLLRHYGLPTTQAQTQALIEEK